MIRLVASCVAMPCLAVSLLWVGSAGAENEGQADLDKATQLKVNADTLSDLTEVINLADSALKKGLDKSNRQFAKNMLASSLSQRGSAICAAVFGAARPDANWPQFRKLALEDLEKSLTMDPKQPQTLLFVAKLNLLPQGDTKRAAQAVDEAIKLSSDEPRLRSQGLLLRAGLQKELKQKLADLDEAVRLAPGDAAAIRARAAVRADNGQLGPALEDLNKAIALEPRHGLTYEAKAMVLTKMKKYDEALALWDKVQTLAPGSALPLMQKASIYGLQANLPAALKELDKANTADPGSLAVLLLRAGIEEELGDKDKALADVQRVLELQPDLPEGLRMHAMMLIGRDQFDAGISELEKLRKLDPKNLLTLLEMATAYNAQKKYQQAIEICSAVLAEHPEQADFLRSRGDARLNQGQRADAIADYDKALKQQPKEVGVLNNLAWVLATAPEDKLRDGKRSLALATAASKSTDYKQDYILSTLAAAYAETGDFTNAIKWSTKAAELAAKTKEHGAALNKELSSYQAHKPWREALPEPEEKKEGKKP